jgi:excisionase family DNA binding protein
MQSQSFLAYEITISYVLISRARFRQNCDPTGKSTCDGLNGLATVEEREAGTPLPRFYLRPDEAARVIGVSGRTLSAWQPARVIGFRRVGRTVLFSVADIRTAIDPYRIAPIGEPKPRCHSVKTGTMTKPVPGTGSEPSTV